MVATLQSIGDKIVTAILAVSGVATGAFALAHNVVSPSHQTAAIVEAAVTVVAPQPVAVIPTDATITPDLLPIVALLPAKGASKPTKIKAAVNVAVPTAAPPAVVATPTITAQWLADNTQLSFNATRDGTYEAAFTANVGTQTLSWGMNDASVGGDNGIPKFSFSVSCNPPPAFPSSEATDQNPSFAVRTSYDCTVTFAATTGSDQKAYSKDLSATTDPGRLIVTIPLSMSSVLNGEATNNGGFVFNNEDTNPVTVTGLTVNLSYTALNILNGPVVFRVINPLTGTSLFDYHLENMSAETGVPYTYAATGVQIPLSFTLGPSADKILPIQILGATPMSMVGINPTVTVTLQSITTNAPDVPTVLNVPQLQWSCVVTLSAYDPNATSGPWATGEACR